MARFIQGVVAKNNLMKQPMVVVNKSGGAGAEGFLDVKSDKGNPHKIVITLSNLFTTPLATGVPFNWRDLTPVQMLALDQFVLWVNAESPHKSAKDFLAAVKAAGADGIFVPGYYAEAALICKQARDLGLKLPLLGVDGWESPDLIAIAGAAGKGMAKAAGLMQAPTRSTTASPRCRRSPTARPATARPPASCRCARRSPPTRPRAVGSTTRPPTWWCSRVASR